MAAFHNSRPDSSEKSAEKSARPVDIRRPRRPPCAALTLAAELARQVGMPRTWPNVQTIRLAIESEADHSGITVNQAATVIAMAAQEWTARSGYSFLPSWEIREIVRVNTIDRFWFEDARWRAKGAYVVMLSRITEARG